jgi:hypothetical protein
VKWLYEVSFIFSATFEEEAERLSKYGADGWELVTVLHTGECTTYYLKKPVETK